MRPKTGLVLLIPPLLACCTAQHPLGADWQSLPIEAREARAIETVRGILAERGSRIPGRPGEKANDVLFVDRRVAVYRPCCRGSGADQPTASLSVLAFEDILRVERRVVYDFPSQPEDLSIYLQRGSPSVWGVRAPESLLSPLLSKVGLEGPALLLPQRPRDTYWRFKAALEHLLSLPRRQRGVGPTVERILRQAIAGPGSRAALEADVLAALAEKSEPVESRSP